MANELAEKIAGRTPQFSITGRMTMCQDRAVAMLARKTGALRLPGRANC
jgi:hypothetical protein